MKCYALEQTNIIKENNFKQLPTCSIYFFISATQKLKILI